MTASARAEEKSGQGAPLLIFPCTANAIEAMDCLGDVYELIAFVDDDVEKQGPGRFGYPVLSRAALAQHPGASVLAVPGSPASYQSRRKVIEGLGIADARFATVIHPSARISKLARIGHNVLIMAGAVVTSNAVIGNHVFILPNSVIHHDVVVGAWTLVGSNVTIAGHTVLGENCYIGSGASIMNSLKIGNNALVGIGSNVIRDVASGARVVGNPARELAVRGT